MDFDKAFNELKGKVTPMKAIKFIVGTLVSTGATLAVIAALKNPLLGAKGLTKLMMKLGIFVLACKIGESTEDYFQEKVDSYYQNTLNEIKEAVQRAQNDITKEQRAKGEEMEARKDDT